MKVLMLSKVFLKGHPRAGEPTMFREKYESGEKIHTIRRNEKGYYKDGDIVSIRQWSGKPRHSKQEIIGECKIGLRHVHMWYRGYILTIRSDNRPLKCCSIAENDGLNQFEFRDWFFPTGEGYLSGDIIHFTDFRY